MLPTESPPGNHGQIGVLAMAPVAVTAFKLLALLALSHLINPSIVEAKERGGDASENKGDLKLVEAKYQRLVENITKSPRNERRLVEQFVEDVFGDLKSSHKNRNGYDEQTYEKIKRDLTDTITMTTNKQMSNNTYLYAYLPRFS